MISVDEDALICDLAETYHVYGLESLPVDMIATLANGLRDDSRVKMKASGAVVSTSTILAALAVDRLSFLAWTKTKDAQRNVNRPESIAAKLTRKESKEELKGYDTPEDFMKARARIIGGGSNGI